MNSPANIRLLAGLDLSEMDGELIRYAGTLQQWLPLEHITFLHCVKLAELPPAFLEPSQLGRIASRIESKFRQMIADAGGLSVPFSVVVSLEEFSELAFLDQVRKWKTGLVLLGNKQSLEGSGALGQKLARMLPAAVMLVPEGIDRIPRRIVAAIDFSKYTAAVVKWSRIAAAAPDLREIVPVNVNRMGYHAFPVFSDKEIEEVLYRETANRARKWAEQFPREPSLQVIPSGGRSVASVLLDYSRERSADMIILGVQGTTSLTSLFMGSVANEILQRNNPPILLLVKP